MSRRPSAQHRAFEHLVRVVLPHTGTLARSAMLTDVADLAIRAQQAARRSNAHEAFVRESGSGPLVVLLNGWSASGLMWPGAFVDDLSGDHTVLRIDNRGTGEVRGAPAPFRIADLADDAAAVIEQRGGGPAIVVGLSMGGMIAQELAIRHPHLIERLVLVATRPPAPAHIQAGPDVLRAVWEVPTDDGAAMWRALCADGFVEGNPEAIDEMVAQVVARRTPRAAILAQMRAIAAWGRPERLRRIPVPTTVVHGRVDRLMPVGNGMRLARMIRGARYVEIPGVGHLVPLEAPRQLIDAIRDA